MSFLHNIIPFLKSYWLVIVLAVIIVIGLLLIYCRKESVIHLSNAKHFVKDLLLVFYGDNYVITLWFTGFIVCSILIGLLGLRIGTHVELAHNHLIVFEVLVLWGIFIFVLKYSKNTYLRSILYSTGSIIFLILCFFLFDWPEEFGSATDRYGYLIGLAGFLASAIGIFVSIRVFMQIKIQNSDNSIEKYLRETISILNKSRPGDDIYIIAPSFCVGVIRSTYLLNSMYDLIQEKAKNGVHFHLAFPSIGNNKKIKQEQTKLIENRSSNDLHWEFLCELLDYIQIPSVSNLLDNIYYQSRSYYKQLININEGVSIHWLKGEYLHHSRYTNTNTYSGFFATVNVGRLSARKERKGGGDCYLGSFYVSDHKLYFVGNGFNNSTINSSMFLMLENEYKKYSALASPSAQKKNNKRTN